MANELEEQKKLVLPYLQRAEEIDKVEPRVAYYCRLYAVDQAVQIPKRAPEINSLLSSAIAQLEAHKPRLVPLDHDADRLHCEGFALGIFKRADRADRAGRADVNTSKAFYAASFFLDILNQFGPLEADLEEKQRYAAWRAADIHKAVKEGRTPSLPPGAQQQGAPAEGGEPGSSSGGDGMPVAPPGEGGSAAGAAAAAAASSSSSTSYGGYPTPSNASSGMAPPPPPPEPPTAAAAPQPHSGGGARPGFTITLFKQGTHVLYYPGGHVAPELGTVGQVLSGGRRLGYKVGLRDRVVDASPAEVSLYVAPGAQLLYNDGSGGPQQAATVVQMDVSRWPPSYLLTVDATGSQVVAGPGEIAPSPAAAAAPLPPAAPQHQPAYPSPHYPDTAPPPAHHQQQPARPSSSSSSAAAPTYGGSYGSTPAAAPTAAMAGLSMTSAAPPPAAVPGYKPPLAAVTQAQKEAKYAVSALSHEDVATAVKHLTAALGLLTNPAAAPAAGHRH